MGTPDQSQKGVGVATAQTALNASTATKIFSSQSRVFGEVKNIDGSIVIYVGPSGVTAGTGYPLAAGAAFGLNDFVGELWAIAASGTPTIASIRW